MVVAQGKGNRVGCTRVVERDTIKDAIGGISNDIDVWSKQGD